MTQQLLGVAVGVAVKQSPITPAHSLSDWDTLQLGCHLLLNNWAGLGRQL